MQFMETGSGSRPYETKYFVLFCCLFFSGEKKYYRIFTIKHRPFLNFFYDGEDSRAFNMMQAGQNHALY